MKTELEIKTGEKIRLQEYWNYLDSTKRWVSLESHEAAMKEAEANKHFAFEAGRNGAKEAFLALLAEQRKDCDDDVYEVISMLEERIKSGCDSEK